jgi:hypothetical protein
MKFDGTLDFVMNSLLKDWTESLSFFVDVLRRVRGNGGNGGAAGSGLLDVCGSSLPIT